MSSDVQPGVYYDMPAEKYHATMALSAGALKQLKQSPAHLYGKQLDPDRPMGDDKPEQFRFGSLAHTLLLEPGKFADEYLVKPAGIDERTKEGKAWAAENAGRDIVTQQDYDTAMRMAQRMSELPDVARLLGGEGGNEVSIFWIDPEYGFLCKCRPDRLALREVGAVVFDYKTCQDASPGGFSRACANYDYHLQADWYTRGVRQAFGDVLGFVFGAIEKEYPHACATYMLDDVAMQLAAAKNDELRKVYAECLRTNQWPSYSDGTLQTISLPKWAL
jgi:hypothetical protein